MPSSRLPGQTFQPRSVPGDEQGRTRSTPVQEAVKLMSLRLPTTHPNRAIAPAALLGGQGAAGLGGPSGAGGDALIQLIRRLMQSSGAQAPVGTMAQGMPRPGGAPSAPMMGVSQAPTGFGTPRFTVGLPPSPQRQGPSIKDNSLAAVLPDLNLSRQVL